MPNQQDQREPIEPVASRPEMPGYDIVDAESGRGLLPWRWAVERLTDARTYFVGSTRPDGAPHMMPVWGVWLNGAFYFSSGRHSRKVRNLTADPRCTVSPERGDEAVIVEGVAAPLAAPSVRARVLEAYQAKYGWDMSAHPEPVIAVRPRVVFGFIEASEHFAGSATRWRFDQG